MSEVSHKRGVDHRRSTVGKLVSGGKKEYLSNRNAKRRLGLAPEERYPTCTLRFRSLVRTDLPRSKSRGRTPCWPWRVPSSSGFPTARLLPSESVRCWRSPTRSAGG